MGDNVAVLKRDSTGSTVYNGPVELLRANKEVMNSSSNELTLRKNNHSSNLSRYEHSRRIFASLVVYYNRHDAWLTPIPWNSKIRFEPEDMHAKLEVLLPDYEKRRFIKGQSKKIRDLFEPPPGSKRPPKNVLIYGDPGFGKTTLCRKIAHYWASHGRTLPGFSENHTVIVYVKLRTLPDDAVLEDELLKLVLQEENLFKEDPFFRKVRRTLQAFGRNVIVILDGYDEVSGWQQNQIKFLLKSGSGSVFKDASVIVTSRPGECEDLLPLFQKHFILRALSNRSTRRLIQRYFLHSAEIVARLYKNVVVKRLGLEGLSPLVVSVLCYLLDREYQVDFVNPQRMLRLLVPLVVRRSNERQNSGLTVDQLERLLFKLGEFFFDRVEGNGRFTHQDIEDSFSELSGFVITSGLFKTTTYGFQGANLMVEVVHKVMADSLVAYYLEENWTSAIINGGFSLFCDAKLHQLDTLQLKYNVHRVNSEDFTACFNYHHFRFSYQILDKVESCSVTSSLTDVEDNHSNSNCLSVSFNIKLENEDVNEAVIQTLKAVFPESNAHHSLPEIILGAVFKNVKVVFVTDSDAVVFDWFERSDVTGDRVSRPWSSLTKISTKLHVTFTKSWCTPHTICPLLKELLEVDVNTAVNEDENFLGVLKRIRKENVILPFAEADAFFPKAHVKVASAEFRILNKVPFIFRLFSRQNFTFQNCDLLELRFSKQDLLNLSHGLSASTQLSFI